MSSDSSDDEETAKLRAALDPAFTLETPMASKKQIETPDPAKINRQPSPPPNETEWDPGHHSQTFQITQKMKKFIAKRLSEALDKQIKDVRKKQKHVSHEENEGGVYLFTKSAQPICSTDLKNGESNSSSSKRKRPQFKKRKVEDYEDSADEEEKLKSVAVSFDWVVNKNL